MAFFTILTNIGQAKIANAVAQLDQSRANAGHVTMTSVDEVTDK